MTVTSPLESAKKQVSGPCGHLLREPVVQVQGPWLEQVTTRYWNPGGRLSDLVSPQVRGLVLVSTESCTQCVVLFLMRRYALCQRS